MQKPNTSRGKRPIGITNNVLHGFPKELSSLIIVGSNEVKVLCLRIPVRQKLRTFIIDTSTYDNYLFTNFMGLQMYQTEKVIGTSKYVSCMFDDIHFWFSDVKSEGISNLESVCKIGIDGVLGLQYLVDEKINLDFSKIQ